MRAGSLEAVRVGRQCVSRRAAWECLACGVLMLGTSAPVAGQAVEGRVWDARSDRPVPNVLLRLVDEAGANRSATAADSAGRFRLPAPGPGTFRIRAEQLGYQPYEGPRIDVADSSEVRRVEVVLRPAPIELRGLEVSAEQVDSRVRGMLGINPSRLRVRPIRSATIQDYAMRGSSLPDLIRGQQIPSMEILRTRDGPCYQHRGRGCLPVYLDGTRLSRSSPIGVSLDMIGTVVIVLPNEVIAHPEGAVHLYSVGFLR